MDFEMVFSAVGLLAMVGWLTLLISPLIPVWSDRIAGLIVPLVLAATYVAFLLFVPSENGGGFSSFAEVKQLFTNPGALMAGWIHFLAFDLFVGAWICRTARDENIMFWMVLPCLPATFMFGPAGFLLFCAIRAVARKGGQPENAAA
ncbi:ABA4-like family protein [Pyruvatibacter sp.]|uniref:ABA4-like family protein n=1 Tax=Pyruvatibacter sp. TaxID=1981328 RepID=UPI0032EBC243